MATEYDEQIEEEIPGMVYAISIYDTEENDFMPPIISHVDEYELPEHSVREREVGGGVTSYALLRVLESLKSSSGRKKKITWADALDAMHEEIENPEDDTRQAVPTLSTSRPINVREENLRLVNTSKQGVKRALLVGAHYQDEEDESTWLASCHTDVRRIRQHLIHEEGFEKKNILVMMDDDRHHEPLKGSILDALERMCQISEHGDSIFFHFSGHGGTMINQDEYDEDGITHELLAPGNYRDNGGVLMDDELYASFVTKVPEGVHAVAVIDTCHPPSYQSGKTSAIDLPYVCDAGYDEMRASEGYRPGRMLLGAGVVAGAAAVGSKAKKKKKPKKKKHEEEDEEMNDPSNYDDSYEEEKTKSRRKSKSKKKKQEVEREEEEEIDDSYEERPEESERQKSKKKSKHKKKKKEEAPRNEEEYSEERQEEEKPKKKKKKPKKK